MTTKLHDMTFEETVKATLMSERAKQGRGRQTAVDYGGEEGASLKMAIGKGGLTIEFLTDGQVDGVASFPLDTAWDFWFNLGAMLADVERFGPEEISD